MATHLNRGSDELEDVHGIDATPPIDIITDEYVALQGQGRIKSEFWLCS